MTTSRALGRAGESLLRAAEKTPGLQLLLLFGSRARDASHAGSDWDFGYLATPDINPEALRGRLADALETDRIDLVDLERASGLLRYRAARDGLVVFESGRDFGDRFRLEATQFWCDAETVLRRGYEEVLAELTP